MTNYKFSNVKRENYFSQVMDKIPQSNLNDEEVFKILIELTDEMRRNNCYSTEFSKAIFKEVENRIGSTIL